MIEKEVFHDILNYDDLVNFFLGMNKINPNKYTITSNQT